MIDRLSDGSDSENQEEPQTAREGGEIAEGVGAPNFKIMHEERDRGFYRVVFFAGKE